jgi:hypothetical protein
VTKSANARIPGQCAVSRARSQVNRFDAIFYGFESPAHRDRAGNFLHLAIETKINAQNSYAVAGRGQSMSQGSDFNRRAAHSKEWKIGLSYVQKAHKKINF